MIITLSSDNIKVIHDSLKSISFYERLRKICGGWRNIEIMEKGLL